MWFVSHIPTRNNHHCSCDCFDMFLWIKAQQRKANLQQGSTNVLRGASCARAAHSAMERDTWSSLCFTLTPAHLSLIIKLSIYPTPSHRPFQFLPLWTWQVIRMDYRESQEFLRIILHRQNTPTSRLVIFLLLHSKCSGLSWHGCLTSHICFNQGFMETWFEYLWFRGSSFSALHLKPLLCCVWLL